MKFIRTSLGFYIVISIDNNFRSSLISYAEYYWNENLSSHKTDLLPCVDFDVEKSKEYARRVNPDLQFFELSVRTGEGMEKWIEWVMEEQKNRG